MKKLLILLVPLFVLAFTLPAFADATDTDTFTVTIGQLETMTTPGDKDFGAVVIGDNEIGNFTLSGQANYAWKITLYMSEGCDADGETSGFVEGDTKVKGGLLSSYTTIPYASGSAVTLLQGSAGASGSATDVYYQLTVGYDNPPGSYDAIVTYTMTSQ